MRFIGCKTNLLENIKEITDKHAKDAKTFCDIFSGTATVGRYFKQWYEVYSNDLLYFSYCSQRGTIENSKKPTFEVLNKELKIDNPLMFFNEISNEEISKLSQEKRFIQNNFAPTGGRMYLTDENAKTVEVLITNYDK